MVRLVLLAKKKIIKIVVLWYSFTTIIIIIIFVLFRGVMPLNIFILFYCIGQEWCFLINRKKKHKTKQKNKKETVL